MEEIKPENILVSYTKEFDKICKNILHEDVTAQHPQLPLVIRLKRKQKNDLYCISSSSKSRNAF